jgi:hypothetical protein
MLHTFTHIVKLNLFRYADIHFLDNIFTSFLNVLIILEENTVGEGILFFRF